MARTTGTDGTYNDYGIALASKMQMQLRQPQSDVTSLLCNEDFEGDFFRVGDTVKITKPDVSTINISDGAKNCDRPELDELDFDSDTMKIDRAMKYGFQVCDITEAEGRWNYVSASLDIAAQKMRQTHNLRTIDIILKDTTIAATSTALGLGSKAAPIELTPETVYSKAALGAFLQLRTKGAIGADGKYTYGSNPEQPKRTAATMFVPQEGMQLLLTSPFVTDRATVAADEAIRTGGYKEILGLGIEFEPALSKKSGEHAPELDTAAEGAFAIVVGTADTVTRASKVLKPDTFRDHEKYADDYYGLEIYGEKVVSPDSCVVIWAKLSAA